MKAVRKPRTNNNLMQQKAERHSKLKIPTTQKGNKWRLKERRMRRTKKKRSERTPALLELVKLNEPLAKSAPIPLHCRRVVRSLVSYNQSQQVAQVPMEMRLLPRLNQRLNQPPAPTHQKHSAHQEASLHPRLGRRSRVRNLFASMMKVALSHHRHRLAVPRPTNRSRMKNKMKLLTVRSHPAIRLGTTEALLFLCLKACHEIQRRQGASGSSDPCLRIPVPEICLTPHLLPARIPNHQRYAPQERAPSGRPLYHRRPGTSMLIVDSSRQHGASP